MLRTSLILIISAVVTGTAVYFSVIEWRNERGKAHIDYTKIQEVLGNADYRQNSAEKKKLDPFSEKEILSQSNAFREEFNLRFSKDSLAGVKWAKTLKTALQPKALSFALSIWLEKDSTEALNWVKKHPNKNIEKALLDGFSLLAKRLPEKALESAKQLHSELQYTAEKRIFKAWIQRQARRSCESLKQLNNTELALEMLPYALEKWANEDINAACTWLVNAKIKNSMHLLPPLLYIWAKRDTTTCYDFLLKSWSDNSVPLNMFERAFSPHATHSERIASWIEAQDETSRAPLYLSLVKTLIRNGNSNALDYLSRIREDKQYPDFLEQALLYKLSYQADNPILHIQVSELFSLPGRDRLIQTFIRQAPQEALDWLKDEGAEQLLLQGLPNLLEKQFPSDWKTHSSEIKDTLKNLKIFSELKQQELPKPLVQAINLQRRKFANTLVDYYYVCSFYLAEGAFTKAYSEVFQFDAGRSRDGFIMGLLHSENSKGRQENFSLINLASSHLTRLKLSTLVIERCAALYPEQCSQLMKTNGTPDFNSVFTLASQWVQKERLNCLTWIEQNRQAHWASYAYAGAIYRLALSEENAAVQLLNSAPPAVQQKSYSIMKKILEERNPELVNSLASIFTKILEQKQKDNKENTPHE